MDRKFSIDLLKIVMALFVVGIHVNPFAAFGPDISILLGGGLYRVAVPVFFVINGYFFEALVQNGGTRRYVTRILLLYAIWTALYLPEWSGVINNPEPWALIRFMVMGWWQLWYLPGLALAAGMAVALRNWTMPWLIPFMALTFLIGVGITYAMAFDLLHPSKAYFGDATVLHRNGLFTGFPFFMAGILIYRFKLQNRFSLPFLVAIAVFSLLLVLAEGVGLFALAPKGVNHDNLLMLALASPALVLLALKFPRQSRFKTLGLYANGMFFIHVAFVVIGFRHTDLPHAMIFALAVGGSLGVTWILIRTGLARRLL